jgi:hypothetical protein
MAGKVEAGETETSSLSADFDGTWAVKLLKFSNCPGGRRVVFLITITDGWIKGARNTQGSVSNNGYLQFSRRDAEGEHDLKFTGQLKRDRGVGAMTFSGGDCTAKVAYLKSE